MGELVYYSLRAHSGLSGSQNKEGIQVLGKEIKELKSLFKRLERNKKIIEQKENKLLTLIQKAV
jgi:hypothetical protein